MFGFASLACVSVGTGINSALNLRPVSIVSDARP